MTKTILTVFETRCTYSCRILSSQLQPFMRYRVDRKKNKLSEVYSLNLFFNSFYFISIALNPPLAFVVRRS